MTHFCGVWTSSRISASGFCKPKLKASFRDSPSQILKVLGLNELLFVVTCEWARFDRGQEQIRNSQPWKRVFVFLRLSFPPAMLSPLKSAICRRNWCFGCIILTVAHGESCCVVQCTPVLLDKDYMVLVGSVETFASS